MEIYTSENQQLTKNWKWLWAETPPQRAEVWTAQDRPASPTDHGPLSLLKPCADSMGIKKKKKKSHTLLVYLLKKLQNGGKAFLIHTRDELII